MVYAIGMIPRWSTTPAIDHAHFMNHPYNLAGANSCLWRCSNLGNPVIEPQELGHPTWHDARAAYPHLFSHLSRKMRILLSRNLACVVVYAIYNVSKASLSAPSILNTISPLQLSHLQPTRVECDASFEPIVCWAWCSLPSRRKPGRLSSVGR